VKFLLDQDVYAVTGRFVAELGHDVETVSRLGLAAADDSVLLKYAQDHDRIFVTRDRDFGALVFLRRAGPGVAYLRMSPATTNAVHKELKIVLRRYSEADLRKAFVVVEPGRHRYRTFAA